MTSAVAVILIVLGTVSRLIPHPPNFVALGAIALYAGARLPRRWAFLVPLAAMALSDALIDRGTGFPFFSITRMTSYGTFALIVGLSSLLRSRTSLSARFAMSVGASTLFYLTTNFAVWVAPYAIGSFEAMYPATPAGLLACYIAALPFYGNSLMADLLGTGALFSLDALALRLASRRKASLPAGVE